jgi:hypothetical protein
MLKEPVMQENENDSMEVALLALEKSIARWTEKGEQHTTAVPGWSLFRRDEPTEPISGIYEPSICLAAQGAKRVLLGEDKYVCDAHHYLIKPCTYPQLCRLSKRAQRNFTMGSG